MFRFRHLFVFIFSIVLMGTAFSDDLGIDYGGLDFDFFGDSLVAQDGGLGNLPYTSSGWDMWSQLLANYFGQNLSPWDDYANKGDRRNYAVPGAETGDVLNIQLGYWRRHPLSNDGKFHIAFVIAGGNDLLNAAAKDPLHPDAYVFHAIDQALLNTGMILDGLFDGGVDLVILADLPLLGDTPIARFFGKTDAFNQAAKFYNARLQDMINQRNKGGDGENILVLDWALLMAEVFSDPAAFGFGNIKDPGCIMGLFDDGPCDPSSWKRPDAPTYYFFSDWLHPGGGAEKVLFDYARSILQAPFLMGLLPRIPEQLILAHRDALDSSLDAIRAHHYPAGRLVFTGSLAQSRAQLRLPVQFGNSWSVGNMGSVGWTYIHPNASALSGSTIFFARDSGHFGRTESRYALDFYGLTIYHQRVSHHILWTAKAGAAATRYGLIERVIPLGITTRHEVSRTDGYDVWGELSAFYPLFSSQGLVHGPVADITYQRSFIHGFSEGNLMSTSMRFLDQTHKSLRTSLGWRLQSDAVFTEYAIHPSLTVWLTREIYDKPYYVYASLLTFPSVFHLPVSHPQSYTGTVDFGLNGEIHNFVWSLNFSDDVYSPVDHRLSLGLSLSHDFG